MPSPSPNPDWLEDAKQKYQRQLNHVKLYKQLRAKERDVWDKCAAAQGAIDFLVRKVKRLLDTIGVYADFHPSYMAYAFALDKSQKEMEFRVDRIREHAILRDRWGRRGLISSILDAIDQLLILDKP